MAARRRPVAPGPKELTPVGRVINFRPFSWLRAALEEEAATLTAAVRAKAAEKKLPAPAAITLSAVLRSVLAAHYKGRSFDAAYAAAWAEGFLVGLADARQAINRACANLAADADKE